MFCIIIFSLLFLLLSFQSSLNYMSDEWPRVAPPTDQRSTFLLFSIRARHVSQRYPATHALRQPIMRASLCILSLHFLLLQIFHFSLNRMALMWCAFEAFFIVHIRILFMLTIRWIFKHQFFFHFFLICWCCFFRFFASRLVRIGRFRTAARIEYTNGCHQQAKK